MIKEPSKRLGSKNDSTEIKGHPWFADVDWTRVLKKEVLPTYFLKRVSGNSQNRLSSPI